MHLFIGDREAIATVEDPSLRRGLSRIEYDRRGRRTLVVGSKPHTEIQALCMKIARRRLPWFRDPLIEADIVTQRERVDAFNAQTERFT